MISSSSETKHNPGFSFHPPRFTSGHVSFSRQNPSPDEDTRGAGEAEQWLERAPEKRTAILTKVQENPLLFPLHKQLVVGQQVCVLLLLNLLDNSFCLLQQRHGHWLDTPHFTNVRRPVTTRCPLHQVPEPPTLPQSLDPPWAARWGCFLAPPFYRENPARVVKHQPDNIHFWLFQICKGTFFFLPCLLKSFYYNNTSLGR